MLIIDKQSNKIAIKKIKILAQANEEEKVNKNAKTSTIIKRISNKKKVAFKIIQFDFFNIYNANSHK